MVDLITINDIIRRNTDIEVGLKAKTDSGTVVDTTTTYFRGLTAKEINDSFTLASLMAKRSRSRNW